MASSDNLNNDYEIALIDNENDARLCAQLLAQEFSSSNVLGVFNKHESQQLFDHWLWPLITEVLDEKLSFLVRYRPTREIVAAMFANDLFLYDEKHSDDYPRSSSENPSADMFGDMRYRFIYQDFPHKLQPNMVIALTAGATSSQHAGKGIASQLRAHTCNYAKTVRNYQYAFIQTSSAATRHIYLTKLNGKETTIVHPKTWLWKQTNDQDGSYPFQDYNDEPMVNILIELK